MGPTTPTQDGKNEKRRRTIAVSPSMRHGRENSCLPSNGQRVVKRPKPTSTSYLTSFYNDNVKKLNTLQAEMFKKKELLDALRDELVEHKNRYDDVQDKWKNLRDQKNEKLQQLQAKSAELEKSNLQLESRRCFMEQEHALKLQQVRAQSTATKNKLVNDYELQLERLKYTKIKQLENEKNELMKQVEKIKQLVTSNPKKLENLLDERKQQVNTIKQKWIQEFDLRLAKMNSERDEINGKVRQLSENISKNLASQLEEVKKRLEELKKQLDMERDSKEQQDKEVIELRNQITAKNLAVEELVQKSKELDAYLIDTEQEIQAINDTLIREETLRRALHNQLQELRGNIRVFCRIRPFLEGLESPSTSHIKVAKFNYDQGNQEMEISKDSSALSTQKFQFDRIFDKEETNEDVFREIGQLVQSSLDGYKVCIFAYGQTGSGKTYTMLHPGNGVIPLTLKHIFGWTESLKEKGWEYKVSCQFIEIYNEAIIDLLREPTANVDGSNTMKHEIRHEPETATTTVTNVKTVPLDSMQDAVIVLKNAAKLRSTASTASNERSSRSHSIFIVFLSGSNVLTGEKSSGILNLIDLAGSERISVTQVVGERLRETQNINKSLSCLGDVISALGSPDASKRHIPFRNSKLTYLLQYSLMGDSKTLMFVNISPSITHVNETINSLRFASNVNSTKLITRSSKEGKYK